MTTMTMKINGMHCHGCAERISALLEKMPGVRDVSVSFPLAQAEIRYSPHAVKKDKLVELVEKAGFSIESVTRA